MQLSEEQIDAIIDSVATYGDNGGREYPPFAVARAVEAALRAQADARPVAWQETHADGEPVWDEGTFSEIEGQFKHERPLYTHPEASAPGLSDDVSSIRAALIGLANHVRAVPAYSKLLGDMEQVDKAIAILTRASAATVAEPSTPSGWRGRLQEMRDASYTYSQYPELAQAVFDSVIDALGEMEAVQSGQQAGVAEDAARLDWLDEQNRKKNASHGTTYGWGYSVNCNRIALEDHHWPARTVREAIDAAKAAAQQQAEPKRCEYCDGTGDVTRADGEWLGECTVCKKTEPGADEPVFWISAADAEFLKSRMQLSARITALHKGGGKRVPVYFAAQSGQRAGMAEDARDADRYRWLRRGQTFSVVDGIGNNPRADELDAAVDQAIARAAAPTQQQEGGK